MKRWISFMLMLLLSVALVACSDSDADEKKEFIEIDFSEQPIRNAYEEMERATYHNHPFSLKTSDSMDADYHQVERQKGEKTYHYSVTSGGFGPMDPPPDEVDSCKKIRIKEESNRYIVSLKKCESGQKRSFTVYKM
ncbi:hypothetical protein IMZ31_22235 (plasmid) [Pontibacillus sp. ALD_SL1]|uniref:hypothetical protein n=1 Tax=Pontibacillus sp. ALD_SL1 TaxID=2777185 RepID=UPI001A9617BF|nr:hypothetical protein [Pontibacillus sp. ALD_SL1]QST02174.1 hypothetical protein IMZ31_22235 [Pontibacillus sp. ALD_SL1]